MMKNNRDKLNDALGQVDESMVQSAMLHTEGMRAAHLSRNAMIRRRVAVVAAACLSMAFLAGAMLALPLLKADKPPVIVDTSDGEENFYVEAPIVKVVQLSATETAEISDPSIPVNRVESTVKDGKSGFTSFPVLVFDCRPGETVTVKASTDCLGYVDMVWDESADWETKREFAHKFILIERTNPEFDLEPREGVVYYTDTLTVDPAMATIVVSPRYTDPENNLEEVTLTFTVTNEEGQITGAGSFYIGKRYLLNSEERALSLGVPFIRRSAVLGAVRFRNPAEVTEERVTELLDSFTAQTDEVKGALDYSPKTADEHKAYARTDIIRTEFAGLRIIGTASGQSSWEDFSTYGLQAENAPKERNFILFDDGAWIEYRSHGDCNWADCHRGCPNQKLYGEHHAFTLGCHIRTYDGCVYELQKVSPDSERETFVLIKKNAE